MKTSFATLAAVLVTLCTSSTALADTPAPTSGDVPAITLSAGVLSYYSGENDKAPTITTKPGDDIATVEGKDVIIKIAYSGNPEPSVEIFKDGKLILNGGIYSITTKNGICTLVIRYALGEDSGRYTFRLTNRAGTAEASIDVTIENATRSLWPSIL